MDSIQVNSEIGRLEGVILHTPGPEIEQMIPGNIHEALYSDLLNLNIASKEYATFKGVFSKWAKTYQVVDLLSQVLDNSDVRKSLLSTILKVENREFLMEEMLPLTSADLARFLIEGYPFKEGVHPKEFAANEFLLNPLYNLFFTRDASSSMYNQVVIHSMRTTVRDRESYIMEAIFKNCFHAETLAPKTYAGATTEGGDLLIAKDDVLFIGCGGRTNPKGIQYMVDNFIQKKKKQHIIVQELPLEPDSFIHLDMVFTMLAQDRCMVFPPLILANNTPYHSTHIEIDNGKVQYHEHKNFLEATKRVGFDFNPILCGGNDVRYQHREQWHSGANFFALGEGKIIGYSRNTHTIDALANAGFAVLKAEDVCQDRVNMNDYERFVVTFDAAELPRGGGGARCMTMPVRRAPVNW